MTLSYVTPALDGFDSGIEAPSRNRAVWSTVLFVSGLAIANVYCVVARPQPVSDYACVLATISLWVLALPPWLSFVYSKTRTFPFMVLISTAYAVYFILPAFSSTPLFRGLPRTEWATVDQSLELVTVGAIAMMLGTYGMTRALTPISPIHLEIDFARALPLLVLINFVSFSFRIAVLGILTTTFGSLISWIDAVSKIALGALVIAWLRGHLNPWYKLYTISLLGIVVIVGTSTGMLANVALPLASVLLVYGWERRKIPWASMTLMVAILLPFNATKSEFRTAHWTTTSDELGPARMVYLASSFISLAIENVERGDVVSDEALQRNENRTNLLGMMAIVVSETPSTIPYWDGYTYSDLGWHLIPRLLVPNKPSPPIGQDFPRRYELIAYHNYDTSINLAQLIELYINFGPIGVAVGMFAIGIIYALLCHIFSASSGGAAIGSVVLSGLLVLESNFSLAFGGIPLMTIGYYAFLRLLPMETKA